MSLTAQGKKVVGRRRCDSPSPEVDTSPAVEKQSQGWSKDAKTSVPCLSSLVPLLAIALLLGHAALNTDREELLGNRPTWMTLIIFLMVGAVVMRFDFIDAVKEEAEKGGLQSMDQFSLIPAGRSWLILGCAAFFLALAVVWGQGSTKEQAMAMLLGRTAPRSDELLGDTQTWTSMGIFLMLGAVVMRFDFIDAVNEEAEKQGLQSTHRFSLIPGGRRWLIPGFGVALAFAAHHLCISGPLFDEAAIFFLSAALVIILAATFFVIGLSLASNMPDDMPKSKVATN